MRVRPSPFFRLLSNTFSDFGSVGRKRKKKAEKKGEVWNEEIQYLRITSAEPGNDMARFESRHYNNGGRKDRRRN